MVGLKSVILSMGQVVILAIDSKKKFRTLMSKIGVFLRLSYPHFFFFFFFFLMGTQNGHDVPFLESASLKKRERIKQIYKIFKKGNRIKKIMPVLTVLENLAAQEKTWETI